MYKNGPKRKYVVDHIIGDISAGKLVIGSPLPSINELSKQFGVSRVTAVCAYQELRSVGIIMSIPGVGFRVARDANLVQNRIFLFLNDLSSFKDDLYNSLKEGIGESGTVDVYFHHFNPKVYQQIIHENLGQYTAYVVMPMIDEKCDKALESIPGGKLYILDIGLFPYGKKYPSVCQNFENDLYKMLTSASDLLMKYNKFILVHPVTDRLKPIFEGLSKFCRERNFKPENILNAIDRKVTKGECYVIMPDKDLDRILNAAHEAGLEPGKDIGILSYHETPLKSHVANGITTISTDFWLMGQTMAEMILKRKRDHIENPCYLVRRGSL
jgi:DNA-binding transcriptional regulator YhcF (GntR family)